MKKQLTILLSFVFIFFIFQEDSFAQKTTEKKKSEAELELQKAEVERTKVEELYKNKLIDASTRRREIQEINESFPREFYEVGTGYAMSYPEGSISFISGGSQDTETLEYRKTVKESSFTKEFPFTVESNSNKVSISVSGSCKEGEIRIEILMPGGKTYTEVLLDEYGSVNWNKSFSIDEEDDGKTGEWKFSIAAKEATGNFRLSIKTY